jgi:transcriptional regulator with XRE-family HTH domain
MDNEKLGKNIRSLRNQKGWTQIDLAEKLGLTQGIITAYENNAKKPSLEKITTLAGLFGVTTDELIGHAELKIAAPPKSPKLWKKFEQVQGLPIGDKRMVFRKIDGLIGQHR